MARSARRRASGDEPVANGSVADDSSELGNGSVLILGGRSEIGLEVAERIVSGRTVVLAARRSDELSSEMERLLSGGAKQVQCVEFDAADMANHSSILETVAADYGPIAVAVVAFGILGDQTRAERDPSHAVEILNVDLVAQVSVLTVLANILRAQGHGSIVVFSSVAGVRVRKANYVYGAAKAGLDGFACGLGDSLHGSGVNLLLVRPGFVIGKMTEGMSPAPLPSTPGQVADAVVKALREGRERVWVPGTLRWAYAVARFIPQFIWRRLPR